MLRRIAILLLLALPALAQKPATVTLLHFSDYHSHALPFVTDDGERGGIARAVRYLRDERRRGALVFNGGDTINKGAPAWSDKYGCAEWPWLNGIASAMAFGNHDADYGLERFHRCRDRVAYPILSANTAGFARYAVFPVRGVRIGVFAVAGPDFPQLVKVPGLQFGDPVAAAREVVRDLREKERVDAVVLIGHEHQEADYALARAVPGIDLIFGTHSHLRRELEKIPGTETWFISPFQYLAFISRVELTIENHRVTAVRGRLVPVDASMPEDRGVARRVRAMQRALERDPQYRELFAPIGKLDAMLPVASLATMTLDAMRAATQSDVALSTMSSFRRPLPAGTLTMELLRGALPYDNEIVVCSMSGDALRRLLDAVQETYVAGAETLDPNRTYRVATTDYLAFVAYKEVFRCDAQKTGLRAREELRKRLGRAEG
ncbi:MAG TPA: 5'-nucleotidase C-terminal domain-containing protein [Thermoanaerobaculia bacterium]|nr:5'-nucleotidase C-terminal domain-containing protein [Thermoanaerobaculia bacterium]